MTFRAILRGTAAASSLVLASHVADWVATGQTILLQNVHFKLESECQEEVVIEELLSPECAPPRAVGDSSSFRVLSLGIEAVVGVSAAGLLVVAGLIVSVVVIITCWRRHRLIKVNVRGHSRYNRVKCRVSIICFIASIWLEALCPTRASFVTRYSLLSLLGMLPQRKEAQNSCNHIEEVQPVWTAS